MGTSERELMLSGGLYLASDPDLVVARQAARRLTRLYNATTEGETARRRALLEELLGAVGDGVEIEPMFQCDYGWNIRLGARVFMNFGCVILDCAPVNIADNVLIGPGVHIYAATHPTDPKVRETLREQARPVTIGRNAWIGGGAIICPGVTVGADSTIGAGSVVTRDVPAGVVAAGNPCRVLRTL